ncbi:MAG TPA: hypothetical protein VNB94_03725 [Mycobacteriales bacterium]|nr:hypothetical protein [Mycobacteriales bacterium]
MIRMSRQRTVILGVASAAVLVSPVSGIAGAAGLDAPQIADQLIAPGVVTVPVVTVPVVTVPDVPALRVQVPTTPGLPAAATLDAAVAPAAAPEVKLCDKAK